MASSNVQKRKRLTGDNRRNVSPIVTARDPHHGGMNEWGITAKGKLYMRIDGLGRWQKVERVHFTPRRIMVLAELVGRFEAFTLKATNG